MTESDFTGSRLPPRADDKAGKVFPVPGEKKDAIVFTDEDFFIRKIFESDPRKAFELLFKKYYGVLCNHAVRFVFDKQRAEDIVADVFVLFWNSKLFLNVKGSYRAYFFSAVRNKCYTYLKWEIKNEDPDELGNTQIRSTHPTPDEIMQASELHVRIERAVRSLPDRQQQVFLMSRFEGKTNKVIAAHLNLSLKTVEMHLTKSLAVFRKIFEGT
ncbi:MAG TPA: RNA polymerase sigma-70 factor [Puia sp.]|nr:RNA polymerase sigma-70 factor [Puia sp.]